MPLAQALQPDSARNKSDGTAAIPDVRMKSVTLWLLGAVKFALLCVRVCVCVCARVRVCMCVLLLSLPPMDRVVTRILRRSQLRPAAPANVATVCRPLPLQTPHSGSHSEAPMLTFRCSITPLNPFSHRRMVGQWSVLARSLCRARGRNSSGSSGPRRNNESGPR